MRARHFEWDGPRGTAAAVRAWAAASLPEVDLKPIEEAVLAEGDEAVLRLTERFDATERPPQALRLEPSAPAAALERLDRELREALEEAAANIAAVAEAQVRPEPTTVELPQGHAVTVREVPVAAAGVYAPGGRAAYPSSVLMCCLPARAAGVERIALASPPRPDGTLPDPVLAAAALCGVEEVYAMGGAQAIFALAHGTESVAAVDVIAGPGNAWVQEAKRRVYGKVGIDSFAGPSELMVIAGHDAEAAWIALDLCAQAEHGGESSLLVAAVEERVLEAIERAATDAARSRSSVHDAPLALVEVPDTESAIELANAYAPEHLELFEQDAALLAGRVRTAGCVFLGRDGATAFGDYAAGSNHVLPTAGAGRFAGPLGPGVFRRRISSLQMTAASAAALAPAVDAIARAEGFPVHGESAMIRGMTAQSGEER